MSVVIRAVMFANGTPCPIAGQFLKSMDFEAYNGRGYAEWTDDLSKALRFATNGDAWEFWVTVPKCKPIREDGRPNKPLTSTTIEIFDPDIHEPLIDDPQARVG